MMQINDIKKVNLYRAQLQSAAHLLNMNVSLNLRTVDSDPWCKRIRMTIERHNKRAGKMAPRASLPKPGHRHTEDPRGDGHIPCFLSTVGKLNCANYLKNALHSNTLSSLQKEPSPD